MRAPQITIEVPMSVDVAAWRVADALARTVADGVCRLSCERIAEAAMIPRARWRASPSADLSAAAGS
jgi:hypothetical protein